MDAAHAATDRELARLEKKLSRIYARAGKEVGRGWKEYLTQQDQAVKSLQGEYEAAKKTGNKDEIRKAGKRLAAAKQERTLLNKHYQNLVNQLSEQLLHINQTAAALVNGQLPNVYAINYNQTAKSASDAVRGYSFELVDEHTVRNLAMEDKTLLPYKVVDGKKDIRWNAEKINAEVLQGILQGEPIPKIADRLTNVLDMNRVAAVRNARTTITSAENKGRMDMMRRAEEAGIQARKIWIATNDERTREAHAALDGKEAEIDEPFENQLGRILYPGDPEAHPANVYNCRCSLGYHFRGFRK